MQVRRLIPVRSPKAPYQASVEFLHHLAVKYQTPAQDRSQTHENMDSFQTSLSLVESLRLFRTHFDVDENDRENRKSGLAFNTKAKSWSR